MATNLTDVPDDRQCGAKTRAGTPCKNWGIWPSGRCRMHGGQSLGGIASPSLKHGWYSRYWPYTQMRQRLQAQARLERRVAARLEEERERREQREALVAERERCAHASWDHHAPTLLQALATLDALEANLDSSDKLPE